MIDKLIDILGREAELFESFLELLEKQQQALVANDVDEVNRIIERQREKLAESRLLSKQREELVAHIKVANAIDGDLNVSRLLDIVDKESAARLTELRTLILTLTDKITRTRNRNALLLNKSREYIAKTLEMLARVRSPEGIYASSGSEQNVANSVAVDRRA